MLIYLDKKSASLLLTVIGRYAYNPEIANIYRQVEEGLKDYV